MTKSLFNQKDVTEVRRQLQIEQDNLDALTHLEIPAGQAVLDHDHDSQMVRAVLHRQTNAALGKIENIWTRYLSYWYPGTLADFLNQASTYIRQPVDDRWYHPAWRKKITTQFNKLTAAQQNMFLSNLGYPEGSNPAKRKAILKKVLLDKSLGFDILQDQIDSFKEKL